MSTGDAGPELDLAAAGAVMAGFPGTAPGSHIERLIGRGLAGVILFGRNVEDVYQVRSLTRRLQQTAAATGHPPLIVAVDQEGGRVQRLRRGVIECPSAMALGAAGDPDAVYVLSREMAAELAAAGINCNLAPCADVNSDPQNPVIGTRSYGQQPEAVGRLVAAAVRGYQDGGVIATAKHFPGHGATRFDSHLTLPVIDRCLKELEANDLVPFRAAIEAGVGAVMSAHIIFPPLTGDLPATLSRPALTGLLRGSLGFRGLVLTDCMEMAAVRTNRAPGQATVEAVRAGADLVLWSHTAAFQDAAIAALSEEAASDGLTRDRLLDSFRRVRRAREELGRRRSPAGATAASAAAPGAAGLLAAQLAARAITVVRDDRGVLPIGSGGPGVAIADLTSLPPVPEAQRAPGAILAEELAGHEIWAEWRRVALDGGTEWTLQQATAGRRVVCLTRDAILKPEQAAAARLILAACRGTVLAATGLPYDVCCFPGASCCICTYDATADAMRALAGVLAGRIPATGRLPVSVG